MTGWLIIWFGKIEFSTWQKKYLHQIKMLWTYGGPSWFEGSSCPCVPICSPLPDLCKTVSLCVKRCCACTLCVHCACTVQAHCAHTVHCAGSLEALFLRRCVFEAPYHCLSKQSSTLSSVLFLYPQAELHPPCDRDGHRIRDSRLSSW